MSHKATWCLLLVFFSTLLMSQERLVIDRVIAKVGGEIILLSDVEEQYSYLKDNAVDIDEDAKCELLENIIAQKMFIHHAKLDSILVTDEEVNAQLDFRFDNVLAQMNGDEEFFQEYYGATVQEMKEKYRDDQKEQILLERMQQSLIANVNITPEEVQKYYSSVPTDSLPFLSSEVEISEIVYEPNVNAVEEQKALDLITDIRRRIVEDGESFEDLAKTYSMDGSAQTGGDLGFAKRGSYVADFEAAAYSLKNDEISEIVQTEFGFHIIQMIERRGNKIHVRHILIIPEITDNDLEKSRLELDSIRKEVVMDSMSFETAVRLHSVESSPSYSFGGRMKNPKSGDTFFKTGDLPPDIYFAIDTMSVGQLSAPLEYTTPRGEKLYRLIKLDSRSSPHRVSIDKDYDRIKIMAKEGKKSQYMAEWIDEKYNKTFIEIEEDYRGCENLDKWVRKGLVLKP